jgi:hypothetical protein
MTYGLLPASVPRSRNDEMGLLTQPHIRITNDEHAYVSHFLVLLLNSIRNGCNLGSTNVLTSGRMYTDCESSIYIIASRRRRSNPDSLHKEKSVMNLDGLLKIIIEKHFPSNLYYFPKIYNEVILIF